MKENRKDLDLELLEWLIPLGYTEVFRNNAAAAHSMSARMEDRHFIKDGVRLEVHGQFNPECVMAREVHHNSIPPITYRIVSHKFKVGLGKDKLDIIHAAVKDAAYSMVQRLFPTQRTGSDAEQLETQETVEKRKRLVETIASLIGTDGVLPISFRKFREMPSKDELLEVSCNTGSNVSLTVRNSAGLTTVRNTDYMSIPDLQHVIDAVRHAVANGHTANRFQDSPAPENAERTETQKRENPESPCTASAPASDAEPTHPFVKEHRLMLLTQISRRLSEIIMRDNTAITVGETYERMPNGARMLSVSKSGDSGFQIRFIVHKNDNAICAVQLEEMGMEDVRFMDRFSKYAETKIREAATANPATRRLDAQPPNHPKYEYPTEKPTVKKKTTQCAVICGNTPETLNANYADWLQTMQETREGFGIVTTTSTWTGDSVVMIVTYESMP